MNTGFWRGKKVLVTGHTGFKGSWLSLWLVELGAQVSGFSLGIASEPSLYADAGVGEEIESIFCDIRSYEALHSYINDISPDIVIHMAAQSLVRRSYESPIDTYSTNVMGTVNVLEAIRHTKSVRSALIVTSDKCYENKEWLWSYRESDPMGGHDPYSSSKGCAELVTASYRSSYFDSATHEVSIASVRAGNVLGGGDWAEHRLIPDVVASLSRSRDPQLRNPHSVRPWQFVLDALRGYLILVEHLWTYGDEFTGAWNFGPASTEVVSVAHLVQQLAREWSGDLVSLDTQDSIRRHEANLLQLDSGKANRLLGWKPILDIEETIEWIVEWYRGYFDGADAGALSKNQLSRFQRKLDDDS